MATYCDCHCCRFWLANWKLSWSQCWELTRWLQEYCHVMNLPLDRSWHLAIQEAISPTAHKNPLRARWNRLSWKFTGSILLNKRVPSNRSFEFIHLDEVFRFHWVSFISPKTNHLTRLFMFQQRYTLNAMIELTMSFPFSFKALTALFLETLAWAMTNSISFASNPESSISSPSSSSSSFFASPASIALPFPWSWAWLWPACESPLPTFAPSEGVMFLRALSLIWELRSSIFASPNILNYSLATKHTTGCSKRTSRYCSRVICRRPVDWWQRVSSITH